MSSLRLRLLLGTLTWIGVGLVFAGWALSGLFHQHVSRQFRAELTTHLIQLAAQLELDAAHRPVLRHALSDPRFNQPYASLYWQIDRITDVEDGERRGVLRSRSLWDQMLMLPDDALGQGVRHDRRIAGPRQSTLYAVEQAVSVDGQSLRLIVAADERLMAAPIARFYRELWLSLGVLGVGLALAVFIQAQAVLAPLRRLRAALVRVRKAETSALVGSFPAEVMPLVDEFNSVLVHNAAVVERARAQAGNLAHALKTPLSVLSNAAQGRDDALALLLREQLMGMRRQVDYHLSRARSVAAAQRPG